LSGGESGGAVIAYGGAMNAAPRTTPRGRTFAIPLAIALAAALALPAAPARAHDTWFDPRPEGLYLGTGDHFPKQEFTLEATALARHACFDGRGRSWPLVAREQQAARLRLDPAPAAATGCWAQLVEFEVEIEPALVEVYFNDIQAEPALREAWAKQRARGLPFRERYLKHARVHLQGALPREPAMDFDVLIEPGDPNAPNAAFAARAGDEISFRVLRDGRPLAGFAAQFRSELSPAGIWRRTDAEGRVRIQLPLAGRWMLRGTDLRQTDSERGLWRSRFLAFTFELGPRAQPAAAPAAAAAPTAPAASR
jgi:hypothetical protein